ncbi:S41 family peptidase [Pelagerythrobacter marensis]|uniref:Peptidase family S41 family protein n=1 Tax=Pelagerythrobacter marensis TaxID=543877 RepID=A0A0G3X7Q3_9SPHN|nr:S41 family peptidase [Pelagerythrobacter marensis]AKM07227.1 Peptidase family S41 family protein [Pelagerythrobacter marensis]
MRFSCIAALAALALAVPQATAAKDVADAAGDPAQLIEDIDSALRENYVFKDRTSAVIAELKAKAAAGDYAGATSADELAGLLSGDLVDATGDRHFYVGHDPAAKTDSEEIVNPDALGVSTMLNFKALELLPGNVGYLRFDYFSDPDDAHAHVVAAMKHLEGADALIIDMRYNRGGHMGTAQLIMSHLFPGDRDQQLFDYSYTEEGRYVERGMWVLHGVPGRRMVDVPVYILTSTTTFSAAEWFAYSLAELDRATIVGRQTAGAAHPVGMVRVNDRFVMQVPIGQIHGPLSGGDFEGEGVSPDVDVASGKALEVAYTMALTQLEESDAAADAGWYVPLVPAVLGTPATSAEDGRDAVGKYEGREIALVDGALTYSWGGRFSLGLVPLGGDMFAVEGTDEYRLRLVRENGAVTALQREFRKGDAVVYRRIGT